MTPARRAQLSQFRAPADLLARLARDLRHCREAPTAADALDAALTFAVSAWGMCSWTWAAIGKDMSIRRRLAKAAGVAALDADSFASYLAELCPNLALCEALAADPRCLAVRAGDRGWQLLLVEDGETKLIGLERFADVLTFWVEIHKRHLSDVPTLPRAA